MQFFGILKSNSASVCSIHGRLALCKCDCLICARHEHDIDFEVFVIRSSILFAFKSSGLFI